MRCDATGRWAMGDGDAMSVDRDIHTPIPHEEEVEEEEEEETPGRLVEKASQPQPMEYIIHPYLLVVVLLAVAAAAHPRSTQVPWGECPICFNMQRQ